MTLADQTAYWESRLKRLKETAVKTSFDGQIIYGVPRAEMEFVEVNLEHCYKLTMEINQLKPVTKMSKINGD